MLTRVSSRVLSVLKDERPLRNPRHLSSVQVLVRRLPRSGIGASPSTPTILGQPDIPLLNVGIVRWNRAVLGPERFAG